MNNIIHYCYRVQTINAFNKHYELYIKNYLLEAVKLCLSIMKNIWNLIKNPFGNIIYIYLNYNYFYIIMENN